MYQVSIKSVYTVSNIYTETYNSLREAKKAFKMHIKSVNYGDIVTLSIGDRVAKEITR